MTSINFREKPRDNHPENSSGSAYDEIVLGDHPNWKGQIGIASCFKETSVDLYITHDRS